MKRKISVMGMIVALAAVNCGEAEEATDNAPQSSTSFRVRLNPATTAENVTPQIVSALHGQIAPICEEHLGASVRLFNPLDSGAYQDVPCSAILIGGEVTGQAESPLT
jgi:hypothetical protein